MDQDVFKGACLCPALNTSLPVDGIQKLFLCNMEDTCTRSILQMKSENSLHEGEIFRYGYTSSSRVPIFW